MDTSAAREQIAQLLRISQQLKEAVGARASAGASEARVSGAPATRTSATRTSATQTPATQTPSGRWAGVLDPIEKGAADLLATHGLGIPDIIGPMKRILRLAPRIAETLNAGDWGEAEVHLDTVIAALGVAHRKAEVQEETGSWEDDWW
jgi:hypothetical protein